MHDTVSPTQGEREVDAGSKAGDRNPITPEVKGYEGMLPGWEIFKGIFLGDTHKVFNNLSMLDMMWSLRHQCPGGTSFAFNFYSNIVLILVRHQWKLETE